MGKFKLDDKVRLRKDVVIRKSYNNVTLCDLIYEDFKNLCLKIKSFSSNNNAFLVASESGKSWYVGEDALELYQEQLVKEEIPATGSDNKVLTTQKIQNNEIRFQKPKTSCKRGIVPAGSTISGRKDKIAISIGHLSYQICNC